MSSTNILSSAPEVGSWAEEVEQNTAQVDKDGIKTVVDFIDDENGRFRVVTKYQVITKRVPRVVADRKKWRKFGECEQDSAGPQISTTYVAEEVEMQFTRNKEGEQILDVQEDKQQVKASNREHCRHCKGNDHWSTNCPYKEMYELNEEKEEVDDKAATSQPGRYVAPGMRGGDRGGTMDRNRSDENTCRVTNMPMELEEAELRDMFSAIGRVSRVYIARDKITNQPKGFAFVTFESRQDTERAIREINGKPKYHMILKVEWTRPSN